MKMKTFRREEEKKQAAKIMPLALSDKEILKRAAAIHGKIGGSKTSERKARAVRLNGLKGGGHLHKKEKDGTT